MALQEKLARKDIDGRILIDLKRTFDPWSVEQLKYYRFLIFDSGFTLKRELIAFMKDYFLRTGISTLRRMLRLGDCS